MTRILLADDQQVVRQALTCLIEREDDLQVVGGAADGLEVLPLAERLKPDVLITDVAMPGLYGLEVARPRARADAGHRRGHPLPLSQRVVRDRAEGAEFERRRRVCYGCGRMLALTALADDARGVTPAESE